MRIYALSNAKEREMTVYRAWYIVRQKYILNNIFFLTYSSVHANLWVEVYAMSDFQKFLDENLGSIRINEDDAGTDTHEDYDIFKEIRDMITALRHESHLTQKELAAKCGITQANISNLEKGTSKPTIESLKKIADALGMRLVVEFVGREVE